MALRVYLVLKDGKCLYRRFRGAVQGQIVWSPHGTFRVDPEMYTRMERRPVWHYMLIIPLLMPSFFPKPEEWAITFNEGETNPHNMRLLPEEAVKRVSGKTAEGIRQATIADGVRDLLQPKKDMMMLLLMLSVGANIILAIGAAFGG